MPIQPHLGVHPKLGPGAYVHPTALVIGDVVLGDQVSIWPMVVARGDVNSIRIGTRSNVQDGSVLHVSRAFPGNDEGWPLLIGEDVVIGHKVVVHGCTIGDRVLVGIGAIVLDGVEVEPDVVIGAGAVVPPGSKVRVNAVTALHGGNACLLANHGLVAAGSDLAEALRVAIEVETVAEYWWRARAIGTPVKAADNGYVVAAGWRNDGYGNNIVIDHGNGYQTQYAHLNRIYVKVGQVVGKGTEIGQMGSTGRSTGPHLHFEVRKVGVRINPLGFLP